MMDTAPTGSTRIESMPDSKDSKVRDMLFAVMNSLVDKEDDLEVATIAGVDGAAFQVRAAASDIGKLIGKSGRTARAIRIILGASASKHGRRYTLDIGSPRSLHIDSK
jgi:uncharacterized protein